LLITDEKGTVGSFPGRQPGYKKQQGCVEKEDDEDEGRLQWVVVSG